MKTFKIVFVALIVFLTVGILLLYNAFNGNPVSHYLAEKALNRYLQANYPDREFRIDRSFYNFKISGYDFDVTEIGSNRANPYEVHVQGFIKPKVKYDEIYYETLDEPLMEKISQEAEQEILQLLKQKIHTIKNVDISLEIQKGELPPEASWSKELQLKKPIDIFVQIDANNETLEGVYTKAKEMHALLNEQNYHYRNVTINAIRDFDGNPTGLKDGQGYVKYAINFKKNTHIKKKDVTEFEDGNR